MVGGVFSLGLVKHVTIILDVENSIFLHFTKFFLEK